MNFQNKVVWITGASSGIGEALAKQFAKEGAKLVLSARRETELERVKAETHLADDFVMVLPMDMLDMEAFPANVQAVVERFGQIDIMVQNAGISQRSYVKDTDFRVYRDIMELDFFSVVALTKAVLPQMLTQKSGCFVPISSVAGKLGTPLRSGYCAAKHALIGFFDALRAESYKDNIQVTTICPGYIQTNISLSALDAKGQQHGKMDKNQQKGMTSDECARRIVAAIKANRKEVYVGGWYEGLGMKLKRFWPGLLYKMVQGVNS
ncbi:MAG: SDR family oxidoreductase [Spirosomataceae bacterium]